MSVIERPSVCTFDCPDTCSLTVTVEDGRIAKVRGSEAAPFTAGVICNKVARDMSAFVHGSQRILHPRQAQGFVFPGNGDRHIAVIDKLQDKVIKHSGISDFFFHGVRHLAETKLAELQIAPHIRDLLFDHAPTRGSGARYDHHTYRAEMLSALETWSAYVEQLVKPKGVALLR